MQIKTFILAASTTLALAAPVAVAQAKIAPHRSTVHTATAHKKTAKVTVKASTSHAAVAPGVVYVAPFATSPIVTPHYIYVPAATPAPNLAPEDDCANSGNGCTAAEACEVWGEC
jgi:hypothetical protein